MGARGILRSPVFNPPPHILNVCKVFKSVEQNIMTNKIFDTSFTLQLRFFAHHYGPHAIPLAVYLVEHQLHQNSSVRLHWVYKTTINDWSSVVVTVPNVNHTYHLLIEVFRSFGSVGIVGIDDISMSPECFGIG